MSFPHSYMEKFMIYLKKRNVGHTMHKNRIDRLIKKMEEAKLHHMIISDPYAIFYLLEVLEGT